MRRSILSGRIADVVKKEVNLSKNVFLFKNQRVQKAKNGNAVGCDGGHGETLCSSATVNNGALLSDLFSSAQAQQKLGLFQIGRRGFASSTSQNNNSGSSKTSKRVPPAVPASATLSKITATENAPTSVLEEGRKRKPSALSSIRSNNNKNAAEVPSTSNNNNNTAAAGGNKKDGENVSASSAGVTMEIVSNSGAKLEDGLLIAAANTLLSAARKSRSTTTATAKASPVSRTKKIPRSVKPSATTTTTTASAAPSSPSIHRFVPPPPPVSDVMSHLAAAESVENDGSFRVILRPKAWSEHWSHASLYQMNISRSQKRQEENMMRTAQDEQLIAIDERFRRD